MDEMKDMKDMTMEKARKYVERQMGKRWVDNMTDEEVQKVFMIMWHVVKRQVGTIWEAVQNSIVKLALDRAAEKGITYEEAIEEIHEEIKKGDE